MLKEDTKETHPFTRMNKSSLAAGAPTRSAREEWTTVHTYEDALKWHIKWTPWFTKDMIDGILKYAYPSEILKEEGGEELLKTCEPSKIIKREESTNIRMSPIELRKIKKDIIELRKTDSEGPPELIKPDLEPASPCDELTPEQIQKRLNRFWTLNE